MAQDRMYNGLLSADQINHSWSLDAFLLPPSRTDPELAGPRIEGVDEEKLSQVAYAMMSVGKQYLRLGGAIQGFAEAKGVEHESISYGYGHHLNKEVFTKTLPEGSRIRSIGTAAFIKSVDMSFSTLQRESYEEDNAAVGNRVYVTLQDESGLHRQLELGYGYSRKKGRDKPPSPVYTPPELAVHPVEVWVGGHDTAYLKPAVPESSDNDVRSVADRALTILTRAKAL